jgi:histidine ammonia-lyase
LTTIGIVGSVPEKVGSVFLTVIENEYNCVAERLSVSTTESIIVVTREKLVSGGDIVAMKVGGAGDFVGVIVIQVAAGVNESFTDDGASS